MYINPPLDSFEAERQELRAIIERLERELAVALGQIRDRLSYMATEKYEATIQRLETAIREHRDQRGDDRCWLDDEKLYAALPEHIANTALPDKATFLANCERFWKCRQKAGDHYETVAEIVEPLKAAIERLERKIAGAKVCRKCKGSGCRLGYWHEGIYCKPCNTCPACVNGVVFPVEEKPAKASEVSESEIGGRA